MAQRRSNHKIKDKSSVVFSCSSWWILEGEGLNVVNVMQQLRSVFCKTKCNKLGNSSCYSSAKVNKMSGTVHSVRDQAPARDFKRWQYLPVWNLLRESDNQLSHPWTERTMSVMLCKARSNQSFCKQRCMKRLGECWEFMTDTQVALSERSSTPRPFSLGAHSLIETTTVSSSNS